MQILMTPSAKSVAFLQGRDGARGGDRVAIVALAIGLAGSGTGAPLDSQKELGSSGCIEGMDSNNNSRNLSGLPKGRREQKPGQECVMQVVNLQISYKGDCLSLTTWDAFVAPRS